MSIETTFYRIADTVSKKSIEISHTRFATLIDDKNYLKEYRGKTLRTELVGCDPIVFWLATFGHAINYWFVTGASERIGDPGDKSSKTPLRLVAEDVYYKWRDMRDTLNKKK